MLKIMKTKLLLALLVLLAVSSALAQDKPNIPIGVSDQPVPRRGGCAGATALARPARARDGNASPYHNWHTQLADPAKRRRLVRLAGG